MGYGIMPYAVDLKKIASYIGIKDETRKAAVKIKYDKTLKRLKEDLNLDDEDKKKIEILFDNLLNNSFGPKPNGLDGSICWYLLERIISNEGEILDNSAWCPIHIDYIEPLYNIKELQMYFIDEGITQLPSPDDFPSVFTIKNNNLDKAGTAIQQHTETLDDESIQQFLEWIQIVKKYGENLILFYY